MVSMQALMVIGAMTVDGRLARLPPGQLDRKLYMEVDKVLQQLGGRWSRKLRAHEFDDDPEDAIGQVLLDGEVVDRRKELGFFETPPEVVAMIVDRLEPRRGEDLLEPSAGRGAILAGMPIGMHATAIEIDGRNIERLTAVCAERFEGEGGYRVHPGDFLTWGDGFSESFDRVAMNPPFAKQADVDHVTRAARMLRPGGRLVSVMGAGIKFRKNRKTDAFRDLVAVRRGRIEPLPSGSFRASGTGVETVLVTLQGPS